MFYYLDTPLTNTLSDIITEPSSEIKYEIKIRKLTPKMAKITNENACTLNGHQAVILSLEFDPSGELLASASADCTVRIWDVKTKTPVGTLKGILCIFILGHDHWVLSLSWHHSLPFLASGGMDGKLIIWDAHNWGKIVFEGNLHTQWINSISWSPDKNSLRIVTGSKDSIARIWDVRSGRCINTLSQHTDSITAVRWVTETQIVTASRDKTVKIWNTDGQLVRSLDGHSHWINCLSTTADFKLRCSKELISEDTLLATGSEDNSVCIWSIKNNKLLYRLTGHQGPVSCVSFSPNCKFLISASFDKTIRLWDVYEGKLLHVFRGHVGHVYRLCWSPDSFSFGSSSKDSTVKVWDVLKKRLSNNLSGHLDEVYSLDWSISGSSIASGGKDKLLKMYLFNVIFRWS